MDQLMKSFYENNGRHYSMFVNLNLPGTGHHAVDT